MSAGKGDALRRVNGEVYRENFEFIDWSRDATADYLRAHGFREMTAEESQSSSKFFDCPQSHLEFMWSHGFDCANERDAYELRGLLDM